MAIRGSFPEHWIFQAKPFHNGIWAQIKYAFDFFSNLAVTQFYFGSTIGVDKQTYWLISIGVVLLGIGIILGALWGHEAWGTYWGWDPKETASLIAWLIYAVYLHARFIAGWKGPKTAWFAVVGFAAVCFCYYGINVILPQFIDAGLHSYGAPDSIPH